MVLAAHFSFTIEQLSILQMMESNTLPDHHYFISEKKDWNQQNFPFISVQHCSGTELSRSKNDR